MNSSLSRPSIIRLNELMRYSCETGYFVRLITAGGAVAGSIAGVLHKSSGYWVIKVDGIAYPAHVLAWLQETGAWLPNGIDHRDLDRSNNRWDNLRRSTRSQNGANAIRRRNNRSGFKGVSKHCNKWRAQIKKDGKVRFLGLFDRPEDAASAYAIAANALHGEFARHDSPPPNS